MLRTLLASVLALVPVARLLADTPLVRDGKPAARIYLAEAVPEPPAKGTKVKPDPAARIRAEAVADLNYHLTRMSGAALEVVTGATADQVKKPALVVGSLAVAMGAKPTQTNPSKEGFRLLAKDGLVLIGGESDAGTSHGVYELLGRLGCDWVMPGEVGEIIPKSASVTVADLDIASAPAFEIRRLWYSGGARVNSVEEGERFEVWKRRHRGSLTPPPPSAIAGHAWDAFIARHKAEFAKDPTMLALRRGPDGKLARLGPQLEPTHPRVIELFVEDIKAAYAKNAWPKDQPAGFGIGPADGLGYSVSAESQLAGAGRPDPITGDPDVTDLIIKLGNEIQARIEKEYPNVWLGYYVYSVHADYPAKYKPHPRISATFADITYSRFHDFSDPNCKSRAYYQGVVEQWGQLSKEQGNPLFFRGYNWNLAENLVPFTRLKIWGVDLPFYHKHGFRGCNVEAQKMWAVNGPHDYLFMRLCWDVNQDWKQVLKEYCRRSFGPAAAAMETYFLTLVERQHGAGQEAGSYHAIPLIFDKATVAALDKSLRSALATATGPDRTRVEFIATGLDMLKRYLAFHEAMTNFDFPGTKAAFDGIEAYWNECHQKNSDLVTKLASGYAKRFLGKFVEESVKYSTGDYRMVARVPDELPTMLDPFSTGHLMRFQAPEINDSAFLKTKTYSTPWDAQGLGGYRNGAVWYRIHFTLPAEVRGRPVGLFLGAFDDEARVWLNGKLIGTSGRRFSNPAAFDLTDDLKPEGDNLLAVQIVRNSAVNELGTGGLFRPSFLFTGPRLESKAPKPLELKRVLPGGAEGEAEK